MAKVGTCALCLDEGVGLIESHVLPKWVYKRLREDGQQNPNPIYVRRGQRPRTSSQQIKEPMLCPDCDNRRLGPADNYVSRLAYTKEGAFPLLEKVGAIQHASKDGSMVDLGILHREKLILFGVSVIWRAHVATHETCRQVSLGPYGDQVRRFIMKAGPFPSRVRLMMLAFPNVQVGDVTMDRMMVPPQMRRDGSMRVHEFHICGLSFHLSVGSVVQDLPRRAMCLFHSERPFVYLSKLTDNRTMMNALAMSYRAGTKDPT